MHSTCDGLEIVYGYSVREVIAVPSYYIKGMSSINVFVNGTLFLDVDWEFTYSIYGFQFCRRVNVSFAVGAMLEVLAEVVSVPFWCVYRVSRFSNKKPIIWAIKCEPMNDASGDNDIVAWLEGELAQHCVQCSGTFVYEDNFVSVSIFKKHLCIHARCRSGKVDGYIGIEQNCGSTFEVICDGIDLKPLEFSAQQIVPYCRLGLNITRGHDSFHHGRTVVVIEQ